MQQTSCGPLFPDVQMQLKMYFIVPFLRPCMLHNYGVTSASHAWRDCVWPTILDAELYRACPGERVLVAIRFNVIFPHLKHEYENTSTCFSKDAKNLTTYSCVLWCSQIVCIRPYSLNTTIAFLFVNECSPLGHCIVWLTDSASCHIHSHFTWTRPV